MLDERLASTVRAISDVFDPLLREDGNRAQWFVSFGALLWYCRDRLLKIPFQQDFDISLLYGDVTRDELKARFTEYGFALSHELLDNYHRRPLQMTFSPKDPRLLPVDVDVYFWVMGKQYAWHTYDMANSGKKILDEYTFKATPREYVLEPTVKVTWDDIAPQINIPSKIGHLLDTWYPPTKEADKSFAPNSGWLFPNRQYGQSRAPMTKTVQSCKNIHLTMP